MKHAILVLSLALVGCAPGFTPVETPTAPVGVPSADGYVIKGRSFMTVSMEKQGLVGKVINQYATPKAQAATGTSTVTYVNASSVQFVINNTSFAASGFTGDNLNFGQLLLSNLDDNDLKVCGVGGTQKCTKAIIRMYTTGSTPGFVNTTDSYGLPVYSGPMNSTTPLGLNVAGSVIVEQVTISASKHRLKNTDFTNTSYPVTVDFSNGGAGSYQMVFVMEYALGL